MSKTKEYSNSEVTLVWEAQKCIHSAICVKNSPKVFQPKDRPWVKIDAETTNEIVETVKKCPSGALSYYMNSEGDQTSESLETKVEILENGPLIVYGTLKVIDKDGNEETKNKTTAFCRCGSSQNKPYCDGAHVKADFRG